MDSYAICSKCKGVFHVDELQGHQVRQMIQGRVIWYSVCASCFIASFASKPPRKLPALAKVLKATKPKKRRKRAA